MSIKTLTVKVGADTSDFEKKISSLGATAGHQLSHHLGGAFSIGALVAFGEHLKEAYVRIKDLSEQYGISTDKIQELDFAAAHSGLTFEDIAKPLTHVNKLFSDAEKQIPGAEKELARWGLTVKGVNEQTTDQIERLKIVAKAMRENGATAADLFEVFGRGGPKLTAVLRDFEHGHAPIISEDDLNSIKRFEAAIHSAKLRLEAFLAGPLGALAEQRSQLMSGEGHETLLGLSGVAAGPMGVLTQMLFGRQRAKMLKQNADLAAAGNMGTWGTGTTTERNVEKTADEEHARKMTELMFRHNSVMARTISEKEEVIQQEIAYQQALAKSAGSTKERHDAEEKVAELQNSIIEDRKKRQDAAIGTFQLPHADALGAIGGGVGIGGGQSSLGTIASEVRKTNSILLNQGIRLRGGL